MTVKFKKWDTAWMSCDYENLKRFQELVIQDVFISKDGVEVYARKVHGAKIYMFNDHEVDDLLLTYEKYCDEMYTETLTAEELGYTEEEMAWYEDTKMYYPSSNKTTMNNVKKNATSEKSATLVEKKASILLAELALKNYREVFKILRDEEFKLSSFKKEEIQQIIDAALDEKDYELLSKFYS